MSVMVMITAWKSVLNLDLFFLFIGAGDIFFSVNQLQRHPCSTSEMTKFNYIIFGDKAYNFCHFIISFDD